MEEVLSNLAHDATSSKAKNLRDACISATGKLRAIWRKSPTIRYEKLADLLSFWIFQMRFSSIEMGHVNSSPMSFGKSQRIDVFFYKTALTGRKWIPLFDQIACKYHWLLSSQGKVFSTAQTGARVEVEQVFATRCKWIAG